MDIHALVKELRTERPNGRLFNENGQVGWFQMETIEVFLKEDSDFVQIAGDTSEINGSSQLDDVSVELGGYLFRGLKIAVNEHGGVRDVNKGYHLAGARKGGTYLVGQYFDIADGVEKDGHKNKEVWTISPLIKGNPRKTEADEAPVLEAEAE